MKARPHREMMTLPLLFPKNKDAGGAFSISTRRRRESLLPLSSQLSPPPPRKQARRRSRSFDAAADDSSSFGFAYSRVRFFSIII